MRLSSAGVQCCPKNRSAAHGSPCGTERVRRIPGVMTSSSLTKSFRPPALSDPRCHQHRRDFQGFHGVNDQVVRDVVKRCCDVTIQHDFWYPPLVCLLHEAAQDEDHLLGLTTRDMAILWAVSGVDCLALQLLQHFLVQPVHRWEHCDWAESSHCEFAALFLDHRNQLSCPQHVLILRPAVQQSELKALCECFPYIVVQFHEHLNHQVVVRTRCGFLKANAASLTL